MINYKVVEWGDGNSNPTNYVLPQIHENCEIVYYQSCKGVTSVGGEAYTITGDNVIFIPPNTEHDELIQDSGRVMFFRFDCDEVDIPFKKCMFFFKCANSDSILSIIEKIISEQVCKKDYYVEYIDLLIKQLVFELKRMALKKKNPEVVNLVAEYIQTYYYTDINFERLSDGYGYSLSRLRHIFKEEKGISVYQYLIDVRITAAKKYLKTTDFSVQKVAALCGYTEANFITMFNQRMGITPMQYRLKLSNVKDPTVVLNDLK